jgi:hypothetical protein
MWCPFKCKRAGRITRTGPISLKRDLFISIASGRDINRKRNQSKQQLLTGYPVSGTSFEPGKARMQHKPLLY